MNFNLLIYSQTNFVLLKSEIKIINFQTINEATHKNNPNQKRFYPW